MAGFYLCKKSSRSYMVWVLSCSPCSFFSGCVELFLIIRIGMLQSSPHVNPSLLTPTLPSSLVNYSFLMTHLKHHVLCMPFLTSPYPEMTLLFCSHCAFDFLLSSTDKLYAFAFFFLVLFMGLVVTHPSSIHSLL